MLELTLPDGGRGWDVTHDDVRRILALDRAHRAIRLLGIVLDAWDAEAQTSPKTAARADEAVAFADALEAVTATFKGAVPIRAPMN